MASTIAGVISTNNIDLTGVLNEVLALLPTTIPVLIGFISLRKGLSFLIGTLRRA